MYSKINATCRVCLRYGSEVQETSKSLFESHDCSSTIMDKLTMIVNIKIQEDDGLPGIICAECLQELDAAIKFKEKCERSNKLLHCDEEKTLPNAELLIPTESVKEEVDSADDIQYEETDDYDADCGIASDLEIKPETDKTNVEETIDDSDVACVLGLKPKTGITNTEEAIDTKLKSEIETQKDDDASEPQPAPQVVKKSKAIDLKLQCHDCGGTFRTKCKLRVHWKKSHLFEKLICEFCKRAFKSFASLQKHKNKRPRNCILASQTRVEGVGKLRKFYCTFCNYESNKPQSFFNHFNIHTGDRPHICQLCNKGFAQLSSLTYHKEVVHKMIKKQITCHYCGEFVQGRGKIQRHLKKHTNTPVQCDICKKKYKSKKSLIEHMKCHSGIKAYQCDKCDASFYNQLHLYNHNHKVHKKITYKCDTCGMKFANNFSLKKHKVKHTIFEFSCNVCGRFYRNTEDLISHQRVHNKGKAKCLECNRLFCDEKSLRRHTASQKHKRNLLGDDYVSKKRKKRTMNTLEKPKEENIEMNKYII